jgi:hypothetical protein
VDYDAQGRKIIGHSGAFLLGTGTNVTFSPSEQLGILALANSTPVGLPEATAKAFFDYFHYGYLTRDWLALYQAAFAENVEKTQNSSTNYSTLMPPKNPAPSQPLSSYVGTYFNRYYGKLEIRKERPGLVLLLPPRGGLHYELTHWDGDTFTYFFASESTGIARRGLKFSGSGEGKQVLVENLAAEGTGVFVKVD